MPKRSPFRIASPFCHAEDILKLKDAGADEVYCGYIDAKSERLWTYDE